LIDQIDFSVRGIPIPQGSMKAFVVNGKARLTSDNPKTDGWREVVAWEARSARARAGANSIVFEAQEPVEIEIEFYLPPLAKPVKGRLFPSVLPDLDKLCRAIFDALTGVLWVDDGQVCILRAVKHYGDPHVNITVKSLALTPRFP
jgi:Holliday junction resolvase RusA-like endonuclease